MVLPKPSKSKYTMSKLSSNIDQSLCCAEEQCKDFEKKLGTVEATSSMSKVLMTDLLDLAQMDRATFKFSEITFDLLQTVDQTFSLLKHSAKDRGIKLCKI